VFGCAGDVLEQPPLVAEQAVDVLRIEGPEAASEYEQAWREGTRRVELKPAERLDHLRDRAGPRVERS
jgi:hypothetical protein